MNEQQNGVNPIDPKEQRKRRLLKIFTGSENPSVVRFIINLVIAPVVLICLLLMFFAWDAFTRPAAQLTIKNALSAKSYTFTRIINDKESYTVKYNNGVYYSIENGYLSVWTFNDDGETVSCCETQFTKGVDDEQEVLNSLRGVDPVTLNVSNLKPEIYLLNEAFQVDRSSIIWMGETTSIFKFFKERAKMASFYGTEIPLQNKSLICVVAYELNAALKLKGITFQIASTAGIAAQSYTFAVSDINKTNFSFEFKK